MGIGVLAVFMKILFTIWLFVLERKQQSYLDSLNSDDDVDVESSLSESHLQVCV